MDLPYIEALLKPEAYPHRSKEVKLVQTQMSFIFLTGKYAYKVKKPVNLGYLDYTALEKRHFFCHQEVQLNKRLCPDTYLGVVPIVVKDGEFHVEGEGKTIEYAVKMTQLPQERMMDILLSRGEVNKEMIATVAEELQNFHKKAKTNPEIASYGGLGIIRQNNLENFAQTEKYVGISITLEKYKLIESYVEDFIAKNANLFARRAAEGRIRDCHGDLHAAHICFTDDIVIYDCIEFNDRFRYADVASEVAFLAMDLDRYQRADLSQYFVSTYVKLGHDDELLELLSFYKCYRACVRGKVESFKLDDPYISEEEKAKVLTAAQTYFELAESYIMKDD